jgi:hypothetical protein
VDDRSAEGEHLRHELAEIRERGGSRWRPI